MIQLNGGQLGQVSVSVGDVNGDGSVNTGDLGLFVEVLLDPESHSAFHGAVDMNGDGLVNGLDVQPFVEAMLAP